ncbi:MAG: c-type cytochrome [Opitutaceae bacterium]|nr:c-type cytochrome [Opitutaceae bacterium]
MKILNRKYLLTVGLLGFSIMVLGLGSSVSLASDFPEAGDFVRGSKAWSENCMRCHSMRSPSDLRDDQWVTTVFHMRVRAGLTGQETRDILTFLQASNAPIDNSAGDVEPVSKEKIAQLSGGKIYQRNCMACHGANGKGVLPGMRDFTDKTGRLTKTDAQLLNNIINGFQSPGSSMPMPPRGGNAQLSNDELAAILSYIRQEFSK